MKTKFQNFKTKKTRISIAALFVFIFTLVQFSCSKPENGSNGIDGKTGTANVIYSDWAPVTFTGNPTRLGSIIAPKITQEILDRGSVLVYYKNSTGLILLANLTNLNSYIYYYLSIGTIGIVTTIQDPNVASFRYIITPGGVSVNGKVAQTDYSKMSYSQVCLSLQIPE